MHTCHVGDIAYLIESRRFIREGKILRLENGMCLFRFIEGGAIRVRENRLYPTEEAAQAAMDKRYLRDPMKRLAFFL